MFKMGRDTTKPDPVAKDEPARPASARTENILMSNRRQASNNFQKAQRAEQAYRTKKRAAAARQGWTDTKGHFKESARQFAQGFKALFGIVAAVPYIWGEKREAKRLEADEKKKQRAQKQKEKLEAQLKAAQQADAENASIKEAS